MRAFQALVIFALVTSAPLLEAVPPPSPQLTADCTEPAYASDQLVCADAELLELDRLLRERIDRGDPAEQPIPDPGTDEDWFQRSRLCAFQPAHRECLLAAYCLRLAVLAGPNGDSLPLACRPDDESVAFDSFSRAGFARSDVDLEPLLGHDIIVHGYVDHLNVYGNEEVRVILGDWWAGAGPDEQTWRFGLKASERDPAGHSIYIDVPNDLFRDDLLRLFAADASAGRPTQVYLRGQLLTFDAPLNFSNRTGLRMKVTSTQEIRPYLGEP